MGGDGPGCVAQLGLTAWPSRSFQDGRGVGPHCERNLNQPLSRHVAARRGGTGRECNLLSS
jgi:hypothetical protein